jgi:transcriptional regulator with XRE-family HTH domain
MERQLPNAGLSKSKREVQVSTSLISRSTLWSRLRTGSEARNRFVESNLNKNISFQIRGMRGSREWSQEELAKRTGMNQNMIYRLENPSYGRFTISTLKRVASAFDVALIVRFVPFSQLADWVTGTLFYDEGLSPDALAVAGFEKEEESRYRHMGLGSLANVKEETRHTLGSITKKQSSQEETGLRAARMGTLQLTA